MFQYGGEKFEHRKIDFYLFIDLMQVSRDILDLTTKDEILILIGDTPSYLKPFLEDERKIFNLPFSNKPYGCFTPPHAQHNPKFDNKSFVPSLSQMKAYFKYLDTKTFLTKKFGTT